MQRITGSLAVLLAGLALAATAWTRAQEPPSPSRQVTMYRQPPCDCCSRWADHLRGAGFGVTIEDVADRDAVREKYGVPEDLASCHTAVVDGYLVVGHVPVDVVERLLQERPAVAGIAVAGMPIGSPGMEQGDTKEPYDVIAFTKDGKTSVYAKR